jgi:Tfp pilus assembly protein PilZ
MADIRIMIVVNDVEAANAYAEALKQASVSHDVARSFREMAEMAMRTPYNGLIVDVLTLVRSSKDDKIIAYDCINIFPVLRVKWESKQKKINLSLVEHSNDQNVESVLRYFVENRCSSFPARTLRRYKRMEMHLNGLFSTEESFGERTTQQSFTVSVSRGGVFLHTMQTFQQGTTLWLRFVEFAHQEPIPATVRWSLKWGESRSIPGVGLSFGTLSPEQEQEIEKVLK